MQKSSVFNATERQSIDQWQQAQLRDLAWLLLSPNLIPSSDELTASQLAPESLAFDRQEIIEQLSAWDRTPPKTLNDTTNTPKPRLGLHCEDLLALWLSNQPELKLLGRNLQITQPLSPSGQQTLGELDFLYLDYRQNPSEPQLVHLELAVKFYLNFSERFFGPNAIDRLDKKLAQMSKKQLPLAQLEATEANIGKQLRLAGFNSSEISELISNKRSQALIKGQLHFQVQSSCPPPRNQYLWLYWSDFLALSQQHWPDFQWQMLNKHQWLSEAQLITRESTGLKGNLDMHQWLEQYQQDFIKGRAENLKTPRGLGGLKGLMSAQLLGLSPDGGRIQVFLVDSKWPDLNK